MKKQKIITISRQFGSAGRTIGKKVAEKLAIPCYDDEILQKVAAESGFHPDFLKDQGEYYVSHTFFGGALAGRNVNGYNGYSIQDEVWIVQSKIIQELGAKEPCVIVGRCADYLLRDIADCLKVFIHADMDFRAKRIVEVYGERDEKPLKRLADKDKRRKKFYKYYTGLEWGDAKNYDVALDSGRFGIDACVDVIVNLYRMKEQRETD